MLVMVSSTPLCCGCGGGNGFIHPGLAVVVVMVSSSLCGVAVVVVLVSATLCGVAVVVVMVASPACGVAVVVVMVVVMVIRLQDQVEGLGARLAST